MLGRRHEKRVKIRDREVGWGERQSNLHKNNHKALANRTHSELRPLVRVRNGEKKTSCEDAEAFCVRPQPPKDERLPPTPTLSKHNLEIYFAALIFRFISGIRTEARHEGVKDGVLHERENFLRER